MAGIAAALGGSVLKERARNQGINSAENASNKVLSRDTAHQRQLEDERRAILTASLTKQGAPNQTNDMNTRRQEIEASYAAAAAPDTTTRDAPPSQNAGSGQGTVNQEYARSLADALSDYKKSSASQAKVQSYGANKNRLNIALANNGSDIALNAGMANADGQAAQIEAQRRYAKKMQKVGKFGLGDALQLGGTVASMAGASGAGPSYGEIGDFLSPAAYGAGSVNATTGMIGHV
jgi:plasmid stability protein